MSRDAGFSRADIDTGLLADPKVGRLVRQLRDPQGVAAAMCIYTGLVLASWREGRRVTVDECLPAWWIDDAAIVQGQLAAAGLVDMDGRIPEHAWTSWYEPANERREMTLERWRRANDRKRVPRGDREVTAQSPRGDRAPVQDRSDPTGQVLPIQPHRAAKAARGGDPARAGDFIAGPNGITVDRV